MKLVDASILLIDCQTTGMRPPQGQLLEIAWARTTVQEIIDGTYSVESRLVELPEGSEIPWRVQQITGIQPSELDSAVSREVVRDELLRANAAFAVIHYAQFEKPFLVDLLGEKLPFEILCTHQVTKKLFPQLPSRNIRGVSGYFGAHLGEVKRAHDHVRATAEIWRGVALELEARGLTTQADLTNWLQIKTTATKTDKQFKYEYRIGREKRLALPEKPGVYRMKAKNGEVLYVGKATSLRDRVNSYFRGRKGRDTRKLEMLTQVWDLEITECGSALEAALLETDEIKRLDPPYNVSFKRGRRKLVFYSRDFAHASETPDEAHPLGAFRTFNAIEDLRFVLRSLESDYFHQVFHSEIAQETLRSGFALFAETTALNLENRTLRHFLAFALQLFRSEIRARPATVDADSEDADSVDSDSVDSDSAEDAPVTAEEVADKFKRLFLRAGRELWRTKHMTKLLNANVRFETADGFRNLKVLGGKIGSSEAPVQSGWRGLDISDYDRMSVLLSGIAGVPHSIETI